MTRHPSLLIILAITSGLAACATLTSERYTGAVIASETGAMARCQYLGDISASSGLFGFLALKGADNAKQELLRRADVMGASHVVWERPDVGYQGTLVTAKTYRCPVDKAAQP
jgi:surface antigen